MIGLQRQGDSRARFHAPGFSDIVGRLFGRVILGDDHCMKRSRNLLALLMLAAAILAGATVPASSQQVSVPQQATQAVDPVTYVRDLIEAQQFAEARAFIRAYRPNDDTYRYRVEYVEGLILKKQGNYPAAVAVFRSILAQRPEFSFVRIDLADTLYLSGDDDAARHNADLLIAAGVDDQIGGAMRALVGAIDDRRPVRFSGFASIVPSTNINGGTDNQNILIGGLPFVIDPSSRRQSGIGVLLGGEVLFRQTFSKNLAFVGSLGAIGRYYPAVGRIDLFLDGSAGIEKKTRSGIVTASLVARQDYTNFNAAFRELGVQVEGSGFVPTGRLYGRARVTYRDFFGDVLRNGVRLDVNGFYDRFIGPQRFVRSIVGATTERPQSPFLWFDEIQAGAGYNTELPHGFTIYGQATYAYRRYFFPQPFFGRREDHRIDAQVTVTKRNLNLFGLAPQVTYAFSRNFSNSAFDDTTAHSVDIKFVRAF